MTGESLGYGDMDVSKPQISDNIMGITLFSLKGEIALITGFMVDIRILFAVTIKTLWVGVILAHNHPSGKLMPDEVDKQLTEKIRKERPFLISKY